MELKYVSGLLPMRCTRCNQAYQPDDRSLVTIVSEQIDGPSIQGARTREHQIFLCQKCAAARRKTERVFFLAVVVALGAVALAVASQYFLPLLR